MSRSASSLAVITLLVAACSDPPTGVLATSGCSSIADLVTVAPMVGAKVNGHAFVANSWTGAGGIFLDSTGIYGAGKTLTLVGSSTAGGHLRELRVWFPFFHGVGVYSIAYGPVAGASYECDGATAHGFASSETGSDSAWVTAFDSASGQIKGHFSFLATPLWNSEDQGDVSVSDGTFHGMVKLAPPAQAPSCSEFENAPTSDTIVGATIDGRSFLVPGAAEGARLLLDTVQQQFTILAMTRDGGPFRALQVWVYQFHGVGAYGISFGAGEGGAIYDCVGGAGQGSYWSWPGALHADTLRVMSWDSTIGEIEGNFSFVGGSRDSAVAVTGGVFHGTVKKGVYPF